MFQRSEKTMFWKRSVQLAMTGFGNTVAPCIARKSLKTTSKNPTYSDRVFCGGEAGICFTAERKNEVLRTERAAGGDRVRQRCCPVQSTEIPRNDIKKTRPIRIGFFVAEKQGFEPWLRFTRTTPLAGEPLRPLGYFSKTKSFRFQSLVIISHRFITCQ